MKCNSAQENLSLKIDGVLPVEKTGELELHLKECSDCREFYEDLLMGIRMLAATEPQLPDNFDWKLQLKLNQALKDAVGESAYPWEEKSSGRLRWFQNFGAAAAVGMAAVLALAIFAGPSLDTSVSPSARSLNTRPGLAAEMPRPDGNQQVGGDRRSLQPMFQSSGGLYGNGSQYNVATRGAGATRTGSSSLNKALKGSSYNDQQTIKNLRSQVLYQNRVLYQYQQEVKSLRARLDTTGHMGVDLHNDLNENQQ
jgi:hypothetical protein